MSGDELAESDEEGDLERDRAGDGHESVDRQKTVSYSQQYWVLAGLDSIRTSIARSW